jgi:hypothetical protein
VSSLSGTRSNDFYAGSGDYEDDSLSESSESLKSALIREHPEQKSDEDDMSKADTVEEIAIDRNILTHSTSMPYARPPVERSLSAHSAQSIQSAHGVNVNRYLGQEILKEVSKVYKQPLPEELAFVLKHSISIPYSTNSDEDIGTILREYETLCHQTLPADLVLALREASVNLRTPANSTRSRRSRLTRQQSGSFRSTSRSSGMPSILETDDGSPGGPQNQDAEIVPLEITTDSPLIKPRRRYSRDDSADPGVVPGFEAKAGFESLSLESSKDSFSSTGSDNQSLSIDSITSDGSGRLKPMTSPRQIFNESEATQLVSNTNKSHVLQKPDIRMNLGTIASCSVSGDASVIELTDLDSSDHTTRSSNLSALHSSETVSSLGTGGHSREIQASFSGSTANVSIVSQSSSIPTRRLPIGIDVSLPVEGLESDDLNAIFAAAARLMSE